MSRYVYIGFRGPRELREWLNRRALKEITNASTLLRRLIRNYMMQVDREAYNKMEADLTAEEES